MGAALATKPSSLFWIGILKRSSVFAGSVHIGKELCPGQACNEGEDLLLDYDENEQKCICRKHPCKNDNGVAHSCSDEKFPVLAYHYDEEGNLKCQCSVNYQAQKDEL